LATDPPLGMVDGTVRTVVKWTADSICYLFTDSGVCT
jgi:hypothetical protein